MLNGGWKSSCLPTSCSSLKKGKTERTNAANAENKSRIDVATCAGGYMFVYIVHDDQGLRLGLKRNTLTIFERVNCHYVVGGSVCMSHGKNTFHVDTFARNSSSSRRTVCITLTLVHMKPFCTNEQCAFTN